jgi:hypothetical protein
LANRSDVTMLCVMREILPGISDVDHVHFPLRLVSGPRNA